MLLIPVSSCSLCRIIGILRRLIQQLTLDIQVSARSSQFINSIWDGIVLFDAQCSVQDNDSSPKEHRAVNA